MLLRIARHNQSPSVIEGLSRCFQHRHGFISRINFNDFAVVTAKRIYLLYECVLVYSGTILRLSLIHILREEDVGEHDHRRGRVNIEVEELNGSADERSDDDFIARIDRGVFLFVIECCGGCLHNIFLFWVERKAILRTAKETFQSVTNFEIGQKWSKKGIIFRLEISLP